MARRQYIALMMYVAVAGTLAGTLAAQTTAPAAAAPAPARLTLAQAQQRARANSAAFQAALTAVGVAQGARTEARAGLLPAVNFDENYFWTQTNRYVADDGPHEYQSLGSVREALNFGSGATLRRAQAAQALAQAQAEIASRGLAATVTLDYYTVLAARHAVTTAQAVLDSAQTNLKYSQDLERGGEVAHADVLKAQIQVEQSQRALGDAGLLLQQDRLTLAVLLFPQFNDSFTLADDLEQAPAPLPSKPQVEAMAGQRNPEIAAAEAVANQAHQEVGIARASLLPSASLEYLYGMDAHEFATKNQYGEPNLGNKVMATLSIPIFNWGANRAKLRAAHLLDTQAQRELSETQRRMLANLNSFYATARVARDQLASLASTRDLAEQSLRLTQLQYRDGVATILELVSAENALGQAHDAYDNGQVRYRVALAQLQTLTGEF